MLNDELTPEEKLEKMENLILYLDEALDYMADDESAYGAVIDALMALEKQVGKNAMRIVGDRL